MSRVASWPGPEDTLRTQWRNGITVLARENRSAPVVVLDGVLPVGAVDDPADRVGLSSLVSSMLSRGSQHYAYDALNEAIESVGASLYFGGDVNSLSIGITCLSEDFPLLVSILADALRHPTFTQDQFGRVLQRRLVHLQERDQDTAAVASLRFYEAIYAGHPLGRAVSGFRESIMPITRDDVAAFHADRYGPAGAIFAVSGDIAPQTAADLLGAQLGDWSASPSPRTLPPVPHLARPVSLHVPIADKVQTDLVLGVQCVPRAHPDFYAVRVANTILGVFGMMGRLGEIVREQQGLAYYASSSQEAGSISGIWQATAGVNPASLAQARASILEEIARLASEPVSAEELADAQSYLTGVLPLALETNDGIASMLADCEWYGLGLDYLQRYRGLIESVTAEDVLRVAKRYLRPEAMAIVTAGDA